MKKKRRDGDHDDNDDDGTIIVKRNANSCWLFSEDESAMDPRNTDKQLLATSAKLLFTPSPILFKSGKRTFSAPHLVNHNIQLGLSSKVR